jgi:pimeloyl-ACP methyl ester carboxylesterase
MIHFIVKLINTLAKIAPGLTGRIAFFLFCLPRPKKAKMEETHFLATADLTFEEVDGRRYGVYHWGFKGPVALLVHGWESHSGRWRKLVPMLLNAGYQVVAVDAPGHGRSKGTRFTMVEYAGVIRYLLQKNAPVELVVGHSVGATSMVWAMGTMGPGFRPAKALLLCPFSTLRYTLEKSARALKIDQRVMNAMEVRLKAFSGLAMDDIDIAKKAAQISGVDALIIHDRKDKVTSYTESERLHQAWPESRLVLTEGFGHGLTAPEAYQIMEEFVRQDIVV